MLKLYAKVPGGTKRELKEFLITQSENGPSHKGIKGLVCMGGGIQLPLDFRMPAETSLYANMDAKGLQWGTNLGGFIALNFGTYQYCPVHVYKQNKSSTIKAGSVIAKVAPFKYNGGYAEHLHAYVTKNFKSYKIRDLINMKETFAINDWIEFTATTNLRSAPSGRIVAQAKKGRVFNIAQGPESKVLDGKTYTWYAVISPETFKVYWCFDGNMKKTTRPKNDDCSTYIELAKDLEGKVESLGEALVKANDTIEEKEDQYKQCTGVLATANEQIASLNSANQNNIKHIDDIMKIFEYEDNVVSFKRFLEKYVKGHPIKELTDYKNSELIVALVSKNREQFTKWYNKNRELIEEWLNKVFKAGR